MRTVVGIFPTIAEAERVQRSLEQLGISPGSINVVAGNEKSQHDSYLKGTRAGEGSGTAAAAGTGAAIGGGVGLVAGLVALAIPGVGPVIAGGALATALTGLGVGAAAGGLIGAFTEIGVPHEDAHLYEEAVRRGGVVVSAQVTDPMEADVIRVMDQNGARDVHAEADVWRASGWAGPSMGPVVMDPVLMDPAESMASTIAMSQAMSESRAGSRMDQPVSGEVRRGDTPVSESMERTGTERNEAGFSRPARTAGAVTHARSYPIDQPKDQPIDRPMDRVESSGEVRREATSPLDLSSMTDADAARSADKFPERTGPVRLSSDPAWIFGNRWTSDPNYAGRSWSDVESSIRSSWESTHAGPWDSYRDKIRSGFERREDAGTTTSDPLANTDMSSGRRGY